MKSNKKRIRLRLKVADRKPKQPEKRRNRSRELPAKVTEEDIRSADLFDDAE